MDAPVRGSILIVEDDDDTRYTLRSLVQGAGYDVITASDGREAITHIEGRPRRFSLILLDWLLPVMSGPAFLAGLGVDPVHRGTPVLVLSGHDRIVATDLGVTAVLMKPVRSRTLIAVVDCLVGMGPAIDLRLERVPTPVPDETASSPAADARQTARTVTLRTHRTPI